jgi:hypothetical protein
MQIMSILAAITRNKFVTVITLNVLLSCTYLISNEKTDLDNCGLEGRGVSRGSLICHFHLTPR